MRNQSNSTSFLLCITLREACLSPLTKKKAQLTKWSSKVAMNNPCFGQPTHTSHLTSVALSRVKANQCFVSDKVKSPCPHGQSLRIKSARPPFFAKLYWIMYAWVLCQVWLSLVSTWCPVEPNRKKIVFLQREGNPQPGREHVCP